LNSLFVLTFFLFTQKTSKNGFLKKNSADQDTLARMNLGSMASTLDWFNIMAYDMSIGFTKARHQAPLYASTNDPDPWPKSRYYIDHIVQQFLSAGVPSNKIVVGIPAYGHTYVHFFNFL